MFSSQEIQAIRTIIRSLLRGHHISYRVPPFDDELYQECVGEAVRRGYPMDGDFSLRRYLEDGVKYVATAGRHYTHRPTWIWTALYTAANYFVDDVPSRFPSEIPNIYLFNDRFTKGKKQGHVALDALADIIHQASDLFPPVLSNLITTSTLDVVTSNLLDRETASMQICGTARQYPSYQRDLSGFAEPYAFMVFPHNLPLREYVQAMPEVMQFINELNDVLSFYKEELAGENTNYISLIAAQNKESKLDTMRRVAESLVDLCKRTVMILEGCPEACDAYKHFVVGYFDFHFIVERYKLAELDL